MRQIRAKKNLKSDGARDIICLSYLRRDSLSTPLNVTWWDLDEDEEIKQKDVKRSLLSGQIVLL